MFKRTLLAAVALAAATLPAAAGDLLPVKAVQPLPALKYQPCQVGTTSTPLQCSGFYVGMGISGEGSNADIIGSGVAGSVFAGGFVPDVAAGYQYVSGNWIFGAEFSTGYSFDSRAQANGVGSGFNGFRITEDFKVGGNLNGLLGVQQPITIPPQLANVVLGVYAHLGVTQWQLPGAWAVGNEQGGGFLFDLTPRWFGDLKYTYTNFNGAKANGVVINNDQSIRLGINYKLN